MILPTLSINQYPQWVEWKLVDGAKYFVHPDGKPAKSNDPSTWSKLDDIDSRRACFVLSKEDPFFGIDLDDCIDDEGKLNDQACAIVDAFKGKAYIERSQSKRGLHLTGIGKKPEGCQSVFKDGNQRIEIYDHSRFWITTFDSYPDSAVILPCQAQLDDLIERLSKQTVVKHQTTVVSMGSGVGELDRRARQYLQGIPVPTKGNINNTIFSVCGHLHSFRGSDSSKLSYEEILDLVWQWCGGSHKDLTREYVWDRVKTSATCGTARELKYPTTNYQPIDPVEIVEIDLSGEKDEEELLDEWVPTSGLIRMVYDFYHEVAVFPSPIMGMATAIAVMEVVLGQRLQTETGLRTNDLNVVLGPTGCGKEAVEKTISKIFDSANYLDMIMPAGVQSGNGLLGYLSENPVALWVKDEFGVYLENVFGKRKQPMEAQVGRFLLELYNKADTRYSGNAHASGSKNVIEQPHLVLLGMSTYGTIFDTLSFKDVENGLLNRIAFWCVTQQPAMKTEIKLATPPEALTTRVKEWLELRPTTTAGRPDPIILLMTAEARQRWHDHRLAIHERKDREDTGRASMWSRTAARSLKFALCSAASRIPGPGAICDGKPPEIEIEDVNWAIKLSNWLSRSACSLIASHTTDENRGRAEMAILDFARKSPNWVNLREIQRLRRIVRGDLVAAAERLASESKIDFQRQSYGKRERLMVRLINKS